ncbi:Hypothetical protein PHPALM_36385 [Phytophthora palmivora]|uniref:Uncharacterized protein n=1 Tax=Phytophthora palmivora TaxID=4796 RepID=A0A2P4X023_9STRA|nr:Hypothetical protein PHPALM_36385 [Phytophthora palmivora]
MVISQSIQKLAHTWHGPLCVLEFADEHGVCLKIAGIANRFFLVVHVSKIKPVRQFQDRSQTRLTVPEQDRFDFDEALLPEDSWTRDLDNDEYEVEKIVFMRETYAIWTYITMTICEIDRIEIDSRS